MSRRRLWLHVAASSLVGLGGTSAWAGDHRPATSVEPLGTAVHRVFQAQVARAAQDHFVIYDNEWLGPTTKLGPFGSMHLGRIIHDLPATGYSVIIQATPDHAVNQARRNFIVLMLLRAGIGDAEVRVKVDIPAAEGLYGEEAVMLYPMMLTSRFRTSFIGRGMGFGGIGGFGGVGGFGGFGGFGLGGFGGGLGGFGGLGPWGAFGGWGGGAGTTAPPGYRGLGY
jgi:hypothetical protein